MKKTRLVALLLVLVMACSMFVGCFGNNENENENNNNNNNNNNNQENALVIKEGDYTYNSYASSLGTNWNPHTWENSADDAILSYLSSPFVTMAPLNSEEGTYQWIYEMATSITDVTATNQDKLTKYNVTLPEGKTAAEVTKGYVFEIKLNPNAKWENGEVINADDYIYSMQQLLSSKMRNYRANLYYAGESAVAGGLAYYNSEAPIYDPVVPAYGADETPDYSFDMTANKVYIDLTTTGMTLAGYSFKEIKDDYGYIYDDFAEDENGELVQVAFGATYYAELAEQANAYGMIEVTADNYEKVLYVMDQYLAAFGMSIYVMDFLESDEGDYVWDAANEKFVPVAEGQTGTHVYDYVLDNDGNRIVIEDLYMEFLFYHNGYGDKVEYDAVGCYKVDDYTIHYVCQTAIDYNYFLTSCTSTWLVYEDLYEANKKEEGGLTVTTYGTSKDTFMSYGPYKMETFEDDKQIVYVQNPNWYGYQKTESGYLYSVTQYEVDGAKRQQYRTTKVVIDVMTQEVAYQKFLKGELDEYAPTPEELVDYTLSDRLYRVDETYTMSFFFNTNLDVLKALDEGSNDNSVVLSNYNFRKAFSLAFNRADFVTVTEGYTPAYSLMNQLYHYDIYNDPTSSYRKSDPAMQAICNLYGVKYGAGEIYATLEEAYNSITGYNLTEAKALMKTACEELVEAGLYTAGAPITIQIGWKAGAMEDADNAQVAKVQQYLNAAVEGSGFGAITIEGLGNLDNRYADVPAGKFAIGYGAWGGAAFYPFRNFQVYCDTEQYAGQINETGCWDPATETLTLNVKGEDVTMTWQDWSRALIGTGPYANESNELKLEITAAMEEKFLQKYYRIPLCGTTICSLLSYKLEQYTENYNIMYGFGGFNLMSYNYTDAEWTEYVASQGGTLNYK